MPRKHEIMTFQKTDGPTRLNDGPIALANVQNQGVFPVKLVATAVDAAPDFENAGYRLLPDEPIIQLNLSEFFLGVDTPADLHAECEGLYAEILIDHG